MPSLYRFQPQNGPKHSFPLSATIPPAAVPRWALLSDANIAAILTLIAAADPATCIITGAGSAATSISVVSGGLSLPQSSISATGGVTTGFATSGTMLVWTSNGPQTVAYTGISGGAFTGCTGGTGTMSTGGLIAQAGTTSPTIRSPAGSSLGTVALTFGGAVKPRWQYQNAIPNAADAPTFSFGQNVLCETTTAYAPGAPGEVYYQPGLLLPQYGPDVIQTGCDYLPNLIGGTWIPYGP